MTDMYDVLADVADERKRQDDKFGEQNHDPVWWLTILMEEVGEASEVVAQCGLGDPDPKGLTWQDYRTEMVQVAAVAVSAIECFDRDWRFRMLAASDALEQDK